MLRQKGVEETEEYLTGWYSHKGKDGVGLHREDVDEYYTACSDMNGERTDEQSGGVRVVAGQQHGAAFSAAPQLSTVNAADQASPHHPADTVRIQIWRLQQRPNFKAAQKNRCNTTTSPCYVAKYWCWTKMRGTRGRAS